MWAIGERGEETGVRPDSIDAGPQAPGERGDIDGVDPERSDRMRRGGGGGGGRYQDGTIGTNAEGARSESAGQVL